MSTECDCKPQCKGKRGWNNGYCEQHAHVCRNSFEHEWFTPGTNGHACYDKGWELFGDLVEALPHENYHLAAEATLSKDCCAGMLAGFREHRLRHDGGRK